MTLALPRIGIGKMVLLFFVTLGAHPIWWFFRMERAMPDANRSRRPMLVLGALALGWLVGVLGMTGEVYHRTRAEMLNLQMPNVAAAEAREMEVRAGAENALARPFEIAKLFANLVYFVALTWLSLQVRGWLQMRHPEGEYSLAYVSLFGPFYLQRQINRDGASNRPASGLAA